MSMANIMLICIFLIFSISLPSLASRQCGLQGNSLRVIGGQQTKPNQYPWLMRVEVVWTDGSREYTTNCGASIIDEQFALSAAHCFNPPKDAPPGVWRQIFKLTGGDWDQNRLESTEIRLINSKFFKHPDYKDKANDIALIKFSRRLDFDGSDKVLMPICVSKQASGIVNGDDCWVVGWGITSNGGQMSDVVKKVNLPVRPDQECQKAYSEYDPKTMICAGNKTGDDACRGDSGGPFQCRMANGAWLLNGVVSFGKEECATGSPSVFARVDTFLDWIEQEKKKL